MGGGTPSWPGRGRGPSRWSTPSAAAPCSAPPGAPASGPQPGPPPPAPGPAAAPPAGWPAARPRPTPPRPAAARCRGLGAPGSKFEQSDWRLLAGPAQPAGLPCGGSSNPFSIHPPQGVLQNKRIQFMHGTAQIHKHWTGAIHHSCGHAHSLTYTVWSITFHTCPILWVIPCKTKARPLRGKFYNLWTTHGGNSCQRWLW